MPTNEDGSAAAVFTEHDQTDYQSQKNNHGFPAAFQNLQICLKAYGGKEKHHEYFF